jgi:hypothetical protein
MGLKGRGTPPCLAVTRTIAVDIRGLRKEYKGFSLETGAFRKKP